MRVATGLTITVFGLCCVTGCASQAAPRRSEPALTFTTSAHPASPHPTSPHPADPAGALLALAPAPPRAQSAGKLGGAKFASPAEQPACTPLDLRTRYWTSTLDGAAVQRYLSAHPGRHLRANGGGEGMIHGVVDSWIVTLQPLRVKPGTDASNDEIVYEIAPLAHGVGIRVDAEVVPPHASCEYAGGGGQLPAPSKTSAR